MISCFFSFVIAISRPNTTGLLKAVSETSTYTLSVLA